jgi:hypothetical protein
MIAKKFKHDDIDRGLSDQSDLRFLRLMKLPILDASFASSARFAGREGGVSLFCPGPLWYSGQLAQTCFATLINVPIVTINWLAKRGVTVLLTFGAIK